MKKIIPLVLFVLIVSFVAFFFLNNGMAMSTLITQDSAKIAEIYDKAVKGITGHQNSNFDVL